MKHVPPPSKPKFRRERRSLAYDPQVIAWVRRLTGDPDARPTDLDAEQLAFVYREVTVRRRGGALPTALERAFEQAMIDTTPLLSAPEPEKGVSELDEFRGLLKAAELQRFWADWQPPRSPTARGPRPDYAAAKAVLMLMGMTGKSAHLDDNVETLRTNADVRVAFETLERIAAGRARHVLEGMEPLPAKPLAVPGYRQISRHLPIIAQAGKRAAQRARIAMLQELQDLIPEVQIGKYALIDGTDSPAWVAQKPKSSDPSEEMRRRGKSGTAGARTYIRERGGTKRAPEPGDSARHALVVGKFWRGHYEVILLDLLTGLVLGRQLIPADQDEAAAIVFILSDFYRLWREVAEENGRENTEPQIEVIAGDSAWDEHPWCRLLTVGYGIDHAFRLHNSSYRLLNAKESQSGSIKAITADGRLICTHCNEPMHHAGYDPVKRSGLQPGQETKEGLHRVRATCANRMCAQHTSKPGLRMKSDWRKLSGLPHFPDGREKLYALRMALDARLGAVESYHNRIKAGRKLSTKGADRCRLASTEVIDLLHELAALSYTAQVLQDQREQRGIKLRPITPAGEPDSSETAAAEAA